MLIPPVAPPLQPTCEIIAEEVPTAAGEPTTMLLEPVQLFLSVTTMV